MKKLWFHKLFAFIALMSCSFFGKTQEVEVVIASGLDWAHASAVSPNNKYVAKAILNNCSVWDIKTGRMIRNISYSDNLVQQADSIYFDESSAFLMLNMPMSNDQFKVDISNGQSEFIKGPPMDYTNYKYVYSNRLKGTTHLYTDDMSALQFKSPDEKTTLVYKKVKNTLGNNNVMPYAYTLYIKRKGKMTGPLDTLMNTGFSFSVDSKMLFAGQRIYDLELKRQISELKVVPFSGRSVMFYPDTRIPVTSGVDAVNVWDFPKVKPIKLKNLVNFKSSKDGKTLICEYFTRDKQEKEFVKLDLETKKISKPIYSSSKSMLIQDCSNDGTRFAFHQMSKRNVSDVEIQNEILIVDSDNGKTIKKFKNATRLMFTPTNDEVIIDSSGYGWFKFNLKTNNKQKFPVEGMNSSTYLIGGSQDHKYLVGSQSTMKDLSEFASIVKVWDASSGALLFEQEVLGSSISAVQVSPDGELLAFASSKNHKIFIYNLKNGQKKYELEGHTTYIEETHFSFDSKRLISSALDGTRRIWNIEKGTPMVSLMSTGGRDFAIVTPNKYYYATKGAQRLIHFVKGTEIFPFAQFDLKYNRPDIIIKSLEASHQDLIQPFYYAYQKRLKRMGFTEEMLDGTFVLPTVDIVNSKDLPILAQSNQIELTIAASDENYKLDRILLKVNEVPIGGKKGIDISENQSQQYNESVALTLSSGKNVIEVSVMNEKGVESLASSFAINYEPNKVEQPEIHIYLIGVSEYLQSDYNLTYAAKDANDLSGLFGTNHHLFSKVHVHTLLNEEATKDNLAAWKEDLKNTSVNDVVCLFYAGHGILDQSYNFYLASHDIDFQNPSEKGIPYDEFEAMLDDIPARKKLLLLDACHSGEIDKEEITEITENTENEELADITFRSINASTSNQLSMSSSFELMQELFTDLRRSSGTVIISSAGGFEFAIEGDQWKNGVFTYSFLRGVQDKKADLDGNGQIMLSEMNEYIRDEVFKLTAGKQRPTNRAENINNDWQLW